MLRLTCTAFPNTFRIGSFVSPAEVLVCLSSLFKLYLYLVYDNANVVCPVTIEVLFDTDVKTECETVDTLLHFSSWPFGL